MTDAGGYRQDVRSTAPSSLVGVLADRIAAALIHHEPGWRLPRLTALARRYNVSTAEVDAAIDELTARHLLRRLPDGQVYRASPAEYQVPLEGLTGLTSHVDPMGGELTCRSRQVTARRVPEDTGRALGLAPGETVLVVKCLWLVGGEPGALSATYLPRRLAGLAGEGTPAPLSPLAGPGGQQGGEAPAARAGPDRAGGAGCGEVPRNGGGTEAAGPLPAGLPRAVQVELGPPPPSVARSLRLAAGQSVATVTVRFEDPAAGTPVALTMAMLRPDLFRIVVQAPTEPDGFPGAWAHATEGW
ncbi:MAG: UTRA domain-containing protein [Gemmatimonadota bacterium]